MIQVHTCVSVHCDQCGDALGDPGFETHYPRERSAVTAAVARGWRLDRRGQWWCSACAPELICRAEGHQFSGWRRPVTRDGHLGASEYRHCRRCCWHESRPAEPGLGEGGKAEGGEGTDAGEVR